MFLYPGKYHPFIGPYLLVSHCLVTSNYISSKNTQEKYNFYKSLSPSPSYSLVPKVIRLYVSKSLGILVKNLGFSRNSPLGGVRELIFLAVQMILKLSAIFPITI